MTMSVLTLKAKFKSWNKILQRNKGSTMLMTIRHKPASHLTQGMNLGFHWSITCLKLKGNLTLLGQNLQLKMVHQASVNYTVHAQKYQTASLVKVQQQVFAAGTLIKTPVEIPDRRQACSQRTGMNHMTNVLITWKYAKQLLKTPLSLNSPWTSTVEYTLKLMWSLKTTFVNINSHSKRK